MMLAGGVIASLSGPLEEPSFVYAGGALAMIGVIFDISGMVQLGKIERSSNYYLDNR